VAKKGKIAVEKWSFGGKKCAIGLEKLRTFGQTRKAKWCKMQVMVLNLA
jgi:hypothetical protein